MKRRDYGDAKPCSPVRLVHHDSMSSSARSAMILYGLLGYFQNDVTHGSIERIG